METAIEKSRDLVQMFKFVLKFVQEDGIRFILCSNELVNCSFRVTATITYLNFHSIINQIRHEEESSQELFMKLFKWTDSEFSVYDPWLDEGTSSKYHH